MTTREEIDVALRNWVATLPVELRNRILHKHAASLIALFMPLLNRAKRTAGTVEVCPNSFHNNSPRCLGETAGGRHDCRWDNCPIRSGAKA